jgi:hypothetical protein
VHVETPTSGTDSKGCHVGRIASKVLNMSLNPFESIALIDNAKVTEIISSLLRGRAFGGY